LLTGHNFLAAIVSAIGEDGVEVLREAGVCEADIERLQVDKALIVPSD